MNELLAWVVFPLVSVAICAGIGALAVRAARADVPGAAVPGLGLATAVAVLGPLYATGAGDPWGLVLLAALAVAGFVLGDVPRPRLGALAGVATYALYIAPIALSGTATFLGYNLLNDTAIHLALVDWIGDHGSHFIAQPPSSYAAAIADYVGTHYPLGSHELLAALRPVVGLHSDQVYQPFIALSAALASGSVYALLRGGRTAALIAFAALSSQLVFSFSLQGSVKELPFIACLATAAAVSRDVRLIALPAAALYAIYGVYALPWIVALAVLGLVVARPGIRRFAAGVVVFLVAIAASISGSIHYWEHGHKVISSGEELGPLGGPIKTVEAAGIWLTGDYRFAPQSHAWVTYLLIALALALALVGVVAGLRARDGDRRWLVFLAVALFAALVSAPASSPYIDAKLLTILSPAMVLATCMGMAALPRGPAIAAALAIGLGLLVSDALAYRIAIVAPTDRLDELAAIDKRFAGRGPILVNEFEEYVKHYMRRSRGSDPYERWTAAHAALRPGTPANPDNEYDLDQLMLPFVERWRLIAVRRSPVASRPPYNFRLAWRGRFYDVWQRDALPAPFEHIPRGGRLNPAGESCPAPKRGHPLIGFVRDGAPVVFDIAASTNPLPPGFYRDAKRPLQIDAGKGGSLGAAAQTGSGVYRFWVRGNANRRSALLVDGHEIGTVQGLNRPDQWIDVGAIRLAKGPHRVELRRPKRSLRPGDGRSDVIGPVAAVPEIPGSFARAETRCTQSYDWLEVIPRAALRDLPPR